MNAGDMLIKMGITPDLKGFRYTLDMVEILKKEPDIKILAAYEMVAKKNNTSGAKVERGIRYAASIMNEESEIYKKVIQVQKNKLTNTRFISLLNYGMEKMEDEKNG